MTSNTELREQYLQKCSDFACPPIFPILEALDAGRTLDVVALDGNSKELFNNRINPLQVFSLCEFLYDYSTLTVLRLQYNFLNNMAVQAIARLIQSNRSLRMLDLTGNQVTEEGAHALVGVLSAPDCGLQALVLRNNPLGDSGALELADMLRVNTSLTLLDMADTHCGIQGLIGVANALMEANNTLKILDLEDAVLQAPQDSTYQHLSRMLAASPSLTDLSLAKHRMVDSQLELLVAQGFSRSRGEWSGLSLRGNRLSPFAGPTLERLLSGCPRLQRLNLSANALGNEGAVSLARCLPRSCAALRELDVRGNGIGDVGLIALAGALPLLHTLQLFLVWGNHMGPGGARALADALQHPALRRLRADVKPYMVEGEVAMALQEV
ncbi:hypothetical protein Agub_g6669 [Astrephomene gubernaculifera]|uniref:Leucine-rich repeat-containing protein 34 n=1 Tax=Astrephomene gubernaculifera TaxID=47775 RepID=A0AAD3DQF4_9CHLO|nr:hypothetical protein Agub_g6669 [Astrephomene gubernaculifera]